MYMEQIRFHPYIQDLLKPLEDSNHSKFLNGVKTVMAYLVGNTVIEENKVLIEPQRDLFEILKDLMLEHYGIIVFKTFKGSVYLWDKETSASVRFMLKDDSYQVMNASLNCMFKSENSEKMLDTPQIGSYPKEIMSFNGQDMKYHNGHQIVDMSI